MIDYSENNRLVWFVTFLAVSMLPSTSATTVAQTRRAQRKATTSIRQRSDVDATMELASFYYRTDDISDRAATQFRKVRDGFPNSKEAETAQYLLGSYYHRKFYIQREKKLKEDIGSLVKAQAQYQDYIDRYAWRSGSPEWIADAYFNLALIALQRGDDKKGEEFLGKMYGVAPYDSKVYIYQVIWSPSSRDVIDSTFDSKPLAQYTNALIYISRQQKSLTFDGMISKIRAWCRSQNSLK